MVRFGPARSYRAVRPPIPSSSAPPASACSPRRCRAAGAKSDTRADGIVGPSGAGSKTMNHQPPGAAISVGLDRRIGVCRIDDVGPPARRRARPEHRRCSAGQPPPAPSASRSATRCVATLKSSCASVYPPSVAVPVVWRVSSPSVREQPVDDPAQVPFNPCRRIDPDDLPGQRLRPRVRAQYSGSSRSAAIPTTSPPVAEAEYRRPCS